MSFSKVRNGIEAVFDASILQKRSFRISVKIPGDQRPKRMENARLGRYFKYSIMRIFAVLMFFFFKYVTELSVVGNCAISCVVMKVLSNRYIQHRYGVLVKSNKWFIINAAF